MNPPDDRGPGSDPFDDLVLDESFIRGASKTEASAQDRADAAARARAAHDELRDRRIAEITATDAARRRDRRRRGIGWLAGTAVVVVALIGVGLWVQANPDLLADGGSRGGINDVLSPLARPEDGPRPTPAASEVPLGTPAPVSGDGPHEFIATGRDGEPAAYDPCRPINVVVNPRTAPFDAELLLDRSLAEVSRRTGLQFVIEGETDEKPSPERSPYQPERYGDRWAPVLIAWSDPLESPSIAGDVAGTGGSDRIDTGGRSVYVSGQVTLDGPGLADDGYGGGAAIQAVIMHELGHLVGLNHVDDPGQLMYEENTGQLAFGPGDLAGLARLGRGPCIERL